MRTLTSFSFPARATTLLLALTLIGGSSLAQDDADGPGASRFLRGAYQAGTVLQTNDFLKGDNQAGEPIDSFHSARLELGWQTDGSSDWHHLYNFPTYGLGLYGADFFNDEELGTPTSLYGFYAWPLHRGGPWTVNFELRFGLTSNWKEYDPINNPKNVAIGLGRSVHIEVGATVEYRLARRWSLIGGLTGTHFSNGGTQRPNHGINQVGPVIFAQHDLTERAPLPVRRSLTGYDDGWDLTFCWSAGKRNLDLRIEDPELQVRYLNRDYFIGNLTVGMGKRFSHKSRLAFGLDFAYDETVGDLIELDAYNRGANAESSTSDNLELALFGGYEVIAHRTHLLMHLGYKVWYKDVPGRLPEFYQRLGVKHFFYRDWFLGLNVRFHEVGSADNLEWNVGYRTGL
jgi:hypothetical protein